jgi:hypothetical protein
VLVSTVRIDDDRPLPRKVLLKASFNCVQGLTGCVRITVRRDPHKKIHFANAHQLAKQIVVKEGIFGQSV